MGARPTSAVRALLKPPIGLTRTRPKRFEAARRTKLALRLILGPDRTLFSSSNQLVQVLLGEPDVLA